MGGEGGVHGGPLTFMSPPTPPGDKGDPKAAVPSEVSQLLTDIGDDMYQQYRSLTRQPPDFDPPSGFGINVCGVFFGGGGGKGAPHI